MKRWTTNWLMLGVALIAACWPTYVMGQGASRDDVKAVEAASSTPKSASRASDRPAVVDLRDRLPEVGMQTMNDCVAWAYGYAARTYMEAVDQGWKPDRPSRIFSPTFIYNQINEGKDKGSLPTRAVELLRDQGAATLRTQPYLAKNYLTQPAPLASEEAPAFRIANFGFVRNGEAVRKLLAAGMIVCVGVRTNPIFSSGRYDIYTREMHERGVKQRRAGQPHGYHAMVIAGYDDHRQAFLFMNSWGKNWGDGGYVWVSYDEADVFNLNDKESERLVDYGVVMVDRFEPVTETDRGYRAVRPDSLTLRHRFRVNGLNTNGNPLYDVTLDLNGPREMLEAIRGVKWQYQGPNGLATFEDPSGQVILTTPNQHFTPKATITFRDGRTVNLTGNIQLPEAVERDIEIRRIDALHYRQPSSKTRHYRWTFVPTMNAQDWAALEKIEWKIQRENMQVRSNLRPNLHYLPQMTKKGEIFTYEHALPSQPLTRQPTLAYPSGINQAPPTGRAMLMFKDGSTYEVPLPEQAFPEPVEGDIAVSHIARPVGDYLGRTWYFVEYKAEIPECWSPLLVGGEFRPEGLRENFIDTRAVLTDGIEPLGYVASDYAWFPFNVSAIIHLRRGPAPQVFGPPMFSFTADSLIAGQVGRARQVSQSNGPNTVEIPGEPAAIRYTDRYLGLDEQGQPHWRFYPFFSELRWGRSWDQPFMTKNWRFSDDALQVTELYDEPIGGLPLDVIETGRGVTMYIDTGLYDDAGKRTARTFETLLDPTTPASTGLTLRAIEKVPTTLQMLEEPPTEPLIEVDLVGGLWEMQHVRRVDHLVDVGGGWLDAWSQTLHDLPRPELELQPAILPLPKDGQPVRAVVRLTDGGVMALETKPVGPVPYTVVPDVSLTAISHYWGKVNGQPHWRATLKIDGQLQGRGAIASVIFTAEDEAGQPVTLTPKDGHAAQTLTPSPLRVTAQVTFNDGRDPTTLHSVILTPQDTILPDGTIALTHQRIYRYQQPYNPRTIDSFAVPDPIDHVAVHLRAPLRDLERVKHVDIKLLNRQGMGDGVGPVAWTVPREGLTVDGQPLPRDVFALVYSLWPYEEASVQAVAHLNDGQTITLEHEFTIAEESWFYEVRMQPMSAKPERFAAVVQRHKPREFAMNDLIVEYVIEGHASQPTYYTPNLAYAFDTQGPVTVSNHRALVFDDGDHEPRIKDRHTAPSLTCDPPAVRPDALVVEQSAGGFRIVPDYNGQHFEAARNVIYEVRHGEQTKRITPIAWQGPGHERFAVQLPGPLPDAVAATIVLKDGTQKPLGQWERSPQ